ncbi:MAG: TolC family protein [Bacteroidetes bacterium]|nr:TolC family protein [Bacteroidota bacterium]
MRQFIVNILLLLIFTQTGFSQTKDLEFYVKTGLQNSPLLKEYRNQISSNRIDSQLIISAYAPQVNAATNNVYAPVINGIGYDAAITNIGSYSALVSANKMIVSKNRLNTQFRAVGLQSDSTINTAKISEQDLKRTIIAQYITTYGDQQQLSNNSQINKVLSEEDVILKKLSQNNIYRQSDYLTFLVTYKQQALQLKQLQIQYQTDFANLNYLCGIFDTSANTTVLAEPDVNMRPLLSADASIYFNRYTIDSLRLRNDIALINLDYRPKLSVFGDAGLVSSQLSTIYKNYGFSLGFNISVPIFDGNRRKLNIQKVKLLENTRTNYKDFFEMQYKQQIAQYLQALNATEGLIDDIKEQVKYTKGLIDVNGKLLQTGDVKISDFVLAINNYLTAQYMITQNSVSRLQIINQINYWNR